jgi:hypothetical protein
MRFGNALTLVSMFVGLLVVACEDKPNASTPATSASAASAPTVQPSATTAPPPAPSASASAPQSLSERLKCSELFPEKSLTGPLANMKVNQAPASCAACGPVCGLVSPAKPFEGVSVTFVCNEKYSKEAQAKKVAELRTALKKTKPISDIGRGGIAGEKEGGMFYEAWVMDDDTDCAVTVDWMRGKAPDALHAAKVAVAAIKAADLK